MVDCQTECRVAVAADVALVRWKGCGGKVASKHIRDIH